MWCVERVRLFGFKLSESNLRTIKKEKRKMGTPDKAYEKEIQRGEFDKRVKNRLERDVDKEPSKKPLGGSFAQSEARLAQELAEGSISEEEYAKRFTSLETSFARKSNAGKEEK